MVEVSYGQYCPVAMSAEILCTRWTMLVIRELVQGSTRFNDLRRGVPRMSPGLLAQRLRELESAGIVRRAPIRRGSELFEYKLTEAGTALGEVVAAFGKWGQTWIEANAALDEANVEHLMWELNCHAKPARSPRVPAVINFLFNDVPERSKARWWLLFEEGAPANVCWEDPGLDVDLYAATDVRTMASIWLGLATVRESEARGTLMLTGDRALADAMPGWLGLSPVAAIPKIGGVRRNRPS